MDHPLGVRRVVGGQGQPNLAVRENQRSVRERDGALGALLDEAAPRSPDRGSRPAPRRPRRSSWARDQATARRGAARPVRQRAPGRSPAVAADRPTAPPHGAHGTRRSPGTSRGHDRRPRPFPPGSGARTDRDGGSRRPSARRRSCAPRARARRRFARSPRASGRAGIDRRGERHPLPAGRAP